MSDALLTALCSRLEEELDGLRPEGDVLQAITDARFGEVAIQIEYEPEAGSIRIGVRLPPPAGGGREFLIWCLSINTEYWDAKVGLAGDGFLVVHADLDADGDLGALADRLVDRVDTILELVDDDLVGWLMEHGLGTPTQRERWASRAAGDGEDED